MSNLSNNLRALGRDDTLNALVEKPTKKLLHSEREAVEAIQSVAMKAAARIETLEATALLAEKVLTHCSDLFRLALPKFNWGASALDVQAISLLNVVPQEVEDCLYAVRNTIILGSK